MMRFSQLHAPSQRILIAALGITGILSLGCPKAPESSAPDGEQSSAQSSDKGTPAGMATINDSDTIAAAALVEAQKAEEAAAETARIEAANEALAQREAALRAREEQLRKEEELRQEKARIAQRQAEAEARERKLAAREKELENYEANLAFQKKELRDREAALEDTSENESGRFEPDIPANTESRGVSTTLGTDEQTREPAAKPEPIYASLEPGRLLEIEFAETVSTATHREGDTFSGRLVQDLTTKDGTLVVAAGAEVIGRVTQVTPLRKVGGRASIEVEFTQLVLSPTDTVAISASFVEMGVDKSQDKKKIAGAAVVGAILGRILGNRSKGGVAGAAAGAVVGAAAVSRSEGKDAEIPRGQIVALQLDEVVTVEVQMTGPVDR